MSARSPRFGFARPLLAIGLLLAGCFTLLGGLAPQESVADEAGAKGRIRWILDLKHGPLRTISLNDATGGARTWHYMVLEVSNQSGHGRAWYPLFQASTDTGMDYLSLTHAEVLEAIKAEEGDDIVSLESTYGMLANGRTIRTVGMFQAVDPLYDRITLRLRGLVDPITIFRFEKYGEQEIVADAAYYDVNQPILAGIRAASEDGDLPIPVIEYREVREERAWEMVYERLGDEFGAEDDPIVFVRESWKPLGTLQVLRVFGK